MHKNATTWTFFLAVLLIPLIAFGVYSWYVDRDNSVPVYGAVNIGPAGDTIFHTIQDFAFSNQDGRTISLADIGGKVVVADFFFTYCGSICPKMTRQMQRVQRYYADDARVALLSFTVDPERDDVEQLATYAQKYDADTEKWSFLTGDKREIYRLARKSFLVTAEDGDGGPNDFIHSEKLVLIDTDKRIRGFYDGTDAEEVDDLILDLERLLAELKQAS